MALAQIPNLTPATAVNGSEQLEAVQAGATVRVTSAQIASTIPPGIVTNSMLANMPSMTVKANPQGITAPPGDYSLSLILDTLGAIWGDVLYRGSSGWTVLPPGVPGQALQTHGAGANPSWASTAGVGTVTQITAGAGLSGGAITASGTIASIETVNLQSGVTSYAFSSSDQATLIEFTNNSSQINATLPGTALASGWWVDVQNTGSQPLVITPASGTINGAASITFTSATGSRIVSNGTNYYIQGGRSSGSTTLTGDATGSGSGSITTTVGSIGGKAVSLAGALSTVGAFSIALTATANTSLTLPTSGTVTALGNSVTGSGAIVLANTPTLITPNVGAATGTSLVVSAGAVSTGTYAGSFTNGIVVDYSSGFGRISVGSATGINFYNGGVANTVLASISSAGALTLTQGIVGTTAAGNAVAGQLGEYISNNVLIGSAVSLTNNSAANVTSISLTAGDWDVSGSVCYSANAATQFNYAYIWVSLTSATLPTMPNSSGSGGTTWGGTGFPSSLSVNSGRFRVNVSTTTTVYLSTQVSFSVNTLSAFGFIGARRVR